MRQFQNGPSPAKSPFGGSLSLIPIGLIGLGLLAYGLWSGFAEIRWALDGKEVIGTIRPTGESGPMSSLGGYTFVVDGKTYTGQQQKMLRSQPTVQYLSSDPTTNRVKGAVPSAMRYVFAFLSIFGGGLLLLISYAQTAVFIRVRKSP